MSDVNTIIIAGDKANVPRHAIARTGVWLMTRLTICRWCDRQRPCNDGRECKRCFDEPRQGLLRNLCRWGWR